MLVVTSSSPASPQVQAYNPQITLSPEQGPAGTQVTVTGTGWTEHSSRGISVPIEIGFANEVARGHPDANGKFSVSLTIPTSASVGELELLAIIGNSGSADATFTVSPPVTGEYSVTMEGAFTAEPDPPGQGTYGREKTIFHPGDTIWYMGAVRNSGQEPVDAYFTWRGKYDDPEIGVEIFSDKNTVTVHPGYTGYYSPGIIPSDAAGPYLNRVTVVVGTDKFIKESRFEIAGGEACMFNAPDFSLDSNQIGHIGWGFKTGLGDEWEYGATEGTSTADNWIKKGTRADMLAEFGSRPHYTRYTCRPWPWIWSNPSAADKEARDGQARPYDAYRDNDLSRAVAVLNRTYGAGMPYLDLVEFLNANYYFESLPNEHEGGAPTRWTSIMPLNPVTEATPTPKPTPTPTPPTPTPTPPAIIKVPVPYKTQWDENAGKGWNNCGPASVSMAMAYYGKDISVEDAARSIRGAPRGGNTDFKSANTKALLDKHGLKLEDVDSLDSMKKQLDLGKPVIMLVHNDHYVRNTTGREWTIPYPRETFSRETDENGKVKLINHIVVVTGYDNQNIYINDPLAIKSEGGKAVADPEVGTNFSVPIETFKLAAGEVGWYGTAVACK
jgi:uncharacterized protein YvpB